MPKTKRELRRSYSNRTKSTCVCRPVLSPGIQSNLQLKRQADVPRRYPEDTNQCPGPHHQRCRTEQSYKYYCQHFEKYKYYCKHLKKIMTNKDDTGTFAPRSHPSNKQHPFSLKGQNKKSHCTTIYFCQTP